MSFTHEKHSYDGILVTFVERSSRLNGVWKTIKKSTYNILAPNKRYQDF